MTETVLLVWEKQAEYCYNVRLQETWSWNDWTVSFILRTHKSEIWWWKKRFKDLRAITCGEIKQMKMFLYWVTLYLFQYAPALDHWLNYIARGVENDKNHRNFNWKPQHLIFGLVWPLKSSRTRIKHCLLGPLDLASNIVNIEEKRTDLLYFFGSYFEPLVVTSSVNCFRNSRDLILALADDIWGQAA